MEEYSLTVTAALSGHVPVHKFPIYDHYDNETATPAPQLAEVTCSSKHSPIAPTNETIIHFFLLRCTFVTSINRLQLHSTVYSRPFHPNKRIYHKNRTFLTTCLFCFSAGDFASSSSTFNDNCNFHRRIVALPVLRCAFLRFHLTVPCMT